MREQGGVEEEARGGTHGAQGVFVAGDAVGSGGVDGGARDEFEEAGLPHAEGENQACGQCPERLFDTSTEFHDEDVEAVWMQKGKGLSYGSC